MITLKSLMEANDEMKAIDKKINRLYNIYKNLSDDHPRKEELKNIIDDLGKRWERVRDADPYEGDKHAFLKYHYTGHIPSHAYDRNEEEDGLSYLGNKSKYPILLAKGKFGPFEVEFRQRDEELKYVAHDERGEIKRFPNGDIVYMTPDEIKAEGLPKNDTTIVAFVDNKPIGLASNEWGAVGVWVEKAYQKQGIGTELLDLHIQQRPNIQSGKGKIGQMTNAGIALTGRYYDKLAKRHGSNWFRNLRVGKND